jgi:4-hydroxy-3-methylbut-2-enyl diphosphate reductase
MGFCMGVRRAVQMMEAAATPESPVASFGTVVHNPLVVEHLERRGVPVVLDLEAVEIPRVAISAHGVGPQVLEAMTTKGLEIVDTTCPIVTRAQQWTRKLADEGYAVIIFGDPEHKEVKGTIAWGRGKVYACPDESFIDALPDDLPGRLGLLSQTTHTEARFADFARALFEKRIDRIHELRVINTLCNATTGQQAAARELAHQVDLVIVVGGKTSANTRHLSEVCREEGVETYQVESVADVDDAWFTGHRVVGVTAGASTPDFSIEEVVARIEAIEPA